MARAESPVPMNFVDDFGSSSPVFATDGTSVASEAPQRAPQREQVAFVNGPGAGAIATTGGRLTATAQAPNTDRERVASVNGPGSGQAPVAAGTQAASAVARGQRPVRQAVEGVQR